MTCLQFYRNKMCYLISGWQLFDLKKQIFVPHKNVMVFAVMLFVGFELGPIEGNSDSRTKKILSFLFHPFLPFALSIQQNVYLQPLAVNVHFRR